MTKKNGNGEAKAKAKADAAAESQATSSWRNYKALQLARNPTANVEALHSRFKAMSAMQKVWNVSHCLT
jgi:hypothetical protein